MSKRLASPYIPPNTTTGSNHPAQTAWFGSLPPVARDRDPVTSHAGHDKIQPKRGTRMAEVLALLKAYPAGLTAQEVEAFLAHVKDGKRVGGYWKRVADLKAAGLAKATGEVRDGGEVVVAT